MRISRCNLLKFAALLAVWAMPLFGVFAQVNPVAGPVSSTEIAPDSLPRFPGGEKAMMQFISRNMRYPLSAVEDGVQGKVLVSFIVDEEGRLADVKIEKGVQPDLDREACRVVALAQGWTPAYANGRPVKYRKVLPIMFKLQ